MSGYMPKSKSDKWITPPELYQKLNEEFNFNFDPCPIEWTPQTHPNGLEIEWRERNFVNPPYSKVADWIKKSSEESAKNKLVVMLINAVTDTKAFHQYIYNKAEIRFLQGRLKFINPAEPEKKQPSPKPSMIVIFRPKK